jgi:hypothetical protein
VDFPEEEAVLPGLSVCWTGEGEVSCEEGKTWRRGDCCVGLVDLTDETSSIASCINVAVLDTGDAIKGELLVDLQLPLFAFILGMYLLVVLSLNKFSKRHGLNKSFGCLASSKCIFHSGVFTTSVSPNTILTVPAATSSVPSSGMVSILPAEEGNADRIDIPRAEPCSEGSADPELEIHSSESSASQSWSDVACS